VLLAPADESDLPDTQFNFSYGSLIELTWQPVGVLTENQWYSVSLGYQNRSGETREKVNWTKDGTWAVPLEYYDDIGSHRSIYWTITVVLGAPGSGEGSAISPPSETWMFRWG
jgi:hypothetical protein